MKYHAHGTSRRGTLQHVQVCSTKALHDLAASPTTNNNYHQRQPPVLQVLSGKILN
jgi:hypothetical protein